MISSKALWHTSSQQSEIHTTQLEPRPGQVVVKTLYSLISQGTERTVACQQVPETMYRRMAVPHMEGAFSLPIKYGYALVGEVVQGPDHWLRKRVHLMHPHQDVLAVDPEHLFILPDDLPAKRACLISNMETALNAVWDAQLAAGDRILVVGFGGVGALTAMLAQEYPATEVFVVEPLPNRQTLAAQLGFTVLDANSAKDLQTDITFHCSGHSGGLQTAIDGTGRSGRIIEMSWYGDRSVEIKLGADFHYGRQELISSQVSSIPLARTARWDFVRRKQIVTKILLHDKWDDLLTQVVPFQEAPDVFRQLRLGKWTALNCCLQYFTTES